MVPPVGKSGSLDEFHQFGNGDPRVVNLRANAVNDLAQVVRGHVRGHAHGDARAAVDEQVGNGRRENPGFGEGLVVVWHEIHRVLVHIVHQYGAEVRKPGLSVTHGRRRIALHGSEISLAVDQPLAHGPRLRHMHESGVDGLVAVRMVIAHRFADDLGTLQMFARGQHAQSVHGEQNPALRGFQPVPHVRQRAGDDH